MGYLVVIIGVAALIVIHEAGHFIAARASGMRVKRFSLGFFRPLVEWQPRGSETVYSIGAIPLGGYVQIDGMSPTEDVDPDDRRAYANQSLPRRLAVIAAGPLANYLAAVVLFAVLFMVGMPMPSDAPVLGTLDPGLPADSAGLRQGDRILSIDGRPISAWTELAEAIHASPGRPLEVRYRRGSAERTVRVTPQREGLAGRIGIRPSTDTVRYGPVEAVGQAVRLSVVTTAGIGVMIWRGITGQAHGAQVAGPLKIVRLGVDWLREGWRSLVYFLGQISVSLFLANFLPLPALDGGRLLFIGVEAVTRRRVSRKIEGYVHAFGLLALVGLLLLITAWEFLEIL